VDVTKLTADDLIVDLSSFNTVTDYAAMRSMNSSGWSKATQGSNYENASFLTQMNGMRNAGMKAGAYHFPDPQVAVPTNVSWFLKAARNYIKDGFLMPMLDVENDPPRGILWNVNNANTFIPGFIAELRRQLNMPDLPVMVYASGSWWDSTLRPDLWGDLSHVFLMEANYNGTPGQTMFRHRRLAVHQYTDKAPTPGVKAPTDRSVILRDNGFSLNDLLIGSDDVAAEDILDFPVNRQGSETGATSLRQIVAWFDSDLNGLKAELKAYIDTKIAEAQSAPPEVDYDKLGASIAKNLHVVLEGE
jgi:lysozyme